MEPASGGGMALAIRVGDFCPMLQYRRASGARRTLLQRVLSFGPGGPKEG